MKQNKFTKLEYSVSVQFRQSFEEKTSKLSKRAFGCKLELALWTPV